MSGENLTRAEAAERAAALNTHSYRVELDLTGDTTFRSVTTVNFSATPGTNTFIDLIAKSVEKIVLNGVDLDPAIFDDSRIPLAGLAAENELLVDATCVYSNTGEGLHRAIDPADGEVYLYSQFEVPDSRRMFAVFEQPDLKAEFTFVVDAPSRWNVFSVSPTPEPLVVSDADGAEPISRWEFTPTERISSYLTCIVAGPYQGETGECTSTDGRTIPLGVYARASLVEYLDAQDIMDMTAAGMTFYEENFGQPYPFRKYDQIFVPEFNAGAMEHPGCVTILDDYVFRSRPTEAIVERRAVTVLHELAHMWFGDLVTMKWWDDLWLNESFAEYMSHLAVAEATRWTDAWVTFNSSEKSWAQAQDQLPSTHPIAADIRDLEDVLVNFDGITYGKGASVLQQLVAWVGREQFMSGVREYFKKKKWSNATLADLLVELEASSGRDLTEWTKLWLQEAGVNILTPRVTEADGVVEKLEILQGSDGRASLRPHRIGVGGYNLVDGKLTRVLYSELDVDGETTEVPDFAGVARPDLILVNDGDLAYAKVRMDEKSLACAVENINAFTDRLARTLVMFFAWDMCRDGEMPATDFAHLVLRALETEDHGTVLRTIRLQLATATNLYSAPATREALQVEVGEELAKLVRNAEPGTDRQFQIALSAVGMAYTDEQIDVVEGWLAGEGVPEGLTVDTGMRWEIIVRLAQAGRIGEAEIEAERAERDNTAGGAAQAARARAGIPDPAVKAAVWKEMTESDITNTIQRMSAQGFGGGDAAVLVPFVETYYNTVEQQWTDRTVEMASNVITHAFPVKLAGRTDLGVDLVATGEAWLAEHADGAPAMLRRVAEALDGARRAVKAQKADV